MYKSAKDMFWYLFTPPGERTTWDISNPTHYTKFGADAPKSKEPRKSVFAPILKHIVGPSSQFTLYAIWAADAADGYPIIDGQMIQDILTTLLAEKGSVNVMLKPHDRDD